jgi:hypothetical protein
MSVLPMPTMNATCGESGLDMDDSFRRCLSHPKRLLNWVENLGPNVLNCTVVCVYNNQTLRGPQLL